MIGCAGVKPMPTPEPPPQSIPPEVSMPPESIPPEATMPEPEPMPPEPNPRALASLELSTQAEALIGEGRLDEAIRTLEQAVNLHPGSGENYYYLAEAWRLKGNASQATEYNTLAAIRFKEDPEWMRRINIQKRRIDRIQ
jgi:hypothetical protein